MIHEFSLCNPESFPRLGRHRARFSWLRCAASLMALCAILVSLSPAAHADSLQALVQRADRILRGKSSAAVVHMDVKTHGYQRTYKMVIWQRDDSNRERTLVKILGPTSWRGYSTLKIGNQLKFYDPKTNHVQAVGNSMLGDSWMGSHFSNDDLVKETRLAVDYTPSLISKRVAKNELGQSATFYRIRLTPKPTAPVVWGRIEFEVWQHDDLVVPVRCDYFTKVGDKNPVRIMRFYGVKEMDGRWVPSEMQITVASKPGEYTRLTYDKLRFDVDIPASKFTEQAMR